MSLWAIRRRALPKPDPLKPKGSATRKSATGKAERRCLGVDVLEWYHQTVCLHQEKPAKGAPPARTPDPNNPCYNYGYDPPPTYRAQIPTDAKIIFIAACDDFNGVLGSLWNITNATQGQALVMPDLTTTPDGMPGSVDLWQGAVEWEQINISLAAGQTIQQAVTAANQYIKANPTMFFTNYSQAWLIVGDPSVKLKP